MNAQFNALQVIAQTPAIRAWLAANDPQALLQVNAALESDPAVIYVYVRSIYGQPKTYVADPDQASALRVLTNGAKTLEDRHLDALAALGFAIEQVADPAMRLAR